MEKFCINFCFYLEYEAQVFVFFKHICLLLFCLALRNLVRLQYLNEVYTHQDLVHLIQFLLQFLQYLSRNHSLVQTFYFKPQFHNYLDQVLQFYLRDCFLVFTSSRNLAFVFQLLLAKGYKFQHLEQQLFLFNPLFFHP